MVSRRSCPCQGPEWEIRLVLSGRGESSRGKEVRGFCGSQGSLPHSSLPPPTAMPWRLPVTPLRASDEHLAQAEGESSSLMLSPSPCRPGRGPRVGCPDLEPSSLAITPSMRTGWTARVTPTMLGGSEPKLGRREEIEDSAGHQLLARGPLAA